MSRKTQQKTSIALEKCRTGISGFDEITGGGVPKGRPTLVCGGAGSGKTLFAMEFLLNGATQYNEPGIFISFEENERELTENVASLGWDLEALGRENKIFLDHVYIERSEIEETGEFNLEGLFIRIESALSAVNAKRIAVDSMEALFSGFSDEMTLRAEIRRLFRWLKEKGLTAVITGEQGKGSFTRHGLEEYISDCVVFLDNRMNDQVATRRIRVVKYRGTSHGANEYPFLITEKGFSVLPITSLNLDYSVSTERISTGVERLDTMLGGQGFFRGSSILVSGTAGTGKSSLAARFAAAACNRGEQALYFSFEESPQQIMRNMGSIGIDLRSPAENGLLHFRSVRASSFGMEIHLSMMVKAMNDINPTVVAIDPISNLSSVGDEKEVKETLTRLIDYMKMKGITSFFTDLTFGGNALEKTQNAISSLMDTWILLKDIELNGERNRGMYVLKSRGMAHSNQIREFLITNDGLQLVDAYIGPGGVLTGTSRINQEAVETAEEQLRQQKLERLRRDLKRRENAMESRMQEIKDAFQSEKEEIEHALAELEVRETSLNQNIRKLTKMRGAD